MIDDSSRPDLDISSDLVARLFNKYKRNNRVFVSIFVVGIILFLLVALAFPFRNKIFERLYPKPKSQATACSGNTQVPANRAGFIFTGGDLGQAISSLRTSLYDTYDLNLGPRKSFFVIGRYAQNEADPLGLRLLMENNLGNVDFKGLRGQKPSGWTVLSNGEGAVSIDAGNEDKSNIETSVRLSNNNGNSTQISQVFKKGVSEGQIIVFGSWVKAANAADVKISVQNSQQSNQEFGLADTANIEPNKWNYVVGFGKVPAGVTNFQLVLKVVGNGKTAWFSSVAASVGVSDQNQTITNLVLQRCGSVWMVDDAPGWEQSPASPFMKPLSADIYAIVYNQFYTQIKNVDPSAKLLPGGLMGAPIIFDNKSGYSPKVFLDNFRTSYKNFFNSEPPIDILGIRYLATDQNRWTDSTDFENYLTKLRNYMDQVTDWKGKPIWITRLGVAKNAPNEGVDFLQTTTKYLNNNSLNIEKWFWYDTCGYNSQMSALFVSNNKICTWPMKLTALGHAYVVANVIPTPSPAPVSTTSPLPSQPVQSSTPSATLVPTAKPVPSPTTSTPVSSDSGKLHEGTSSGINP